MHKSIYGIVVLVLIIAASTSKAQFDFEEEEFQDSQSSLIWFGDFRLRGDTINNIDADPRHEDFERGLFRARGGFMWLPNSLLEIGLAGRVNQSSRDNDDVRLDYDNEKADDEVLDQLYIRLTPSERTEFLLGQSEFPALLTPMVWDEDIRPIGASVSQSVAISSFSSFQFLAGYFHGNHLFDDDSRIGLAQAIFNVGEGKNISYQFALGYLEFDDLEGFPAEMLDRTNRTTILGEFVSEFEIVDTQFAVLKRGERWPMEFRVNLVRNTGADDQRDGGRISFTAGDSRRRRGVEFGIASQRIQRDAVAAAFNDDDWWFPTWMRGTRAYVAYGITDKLRVRLAGFKERRDDQDVDVERVLLDVLFEL
ncbi:MAG: hypothetical protein MJA83_00035 [Gammaproteobacteria bacterium]|nr:hypothetical protein [Gammaproteobacteria bacterium]